MALSENSNRRKTASSFHISWFSTHRWTNPEKNMEKDVHYYASAVRKRKIYRYIFHNFVDFIFERKPVREYYWFERRTIRNVLHNPRSFLCSFFHKNKRKTYTYIHETIFQASIHKAGLRGVVWGWIYSEQEQKFFLRDDAIFYWKNEKERKFMMVVTIDKLSCGEDFCNYLSCAMLL